MNPLYQQCRTDPQSQVPERNPNRSIPGGSPVPGRDLNRRISIDAYGTALLPPRFDPPQQKVTDLDAAFGDPNCGQAQPPLPFTTVGDGLGHVLKALEELDGMVSDLRSILGPVLSADRPEAKSQTVNNTPSYGNSPVIETLLIAVARINGLFREVMAIRNRVEL